MTQALPLREQMKALEHLQELDLKIDQLKNNKGALPAVLKNLDDTLHKIRTSGDVKRNAISEIEKVNRQTKAALDLNKDRLTRSSSRLDSVQNSQEFQAVTKEIEQLKKLNLQLEEQSKKSTQEIEAAQAELTQIETQLQKNQKERDEQAAVLAGQSTQFDSQIGTLTSERAKYTSQVEPRILAQYDRVRSARGGLGIVPALGGRCKGCNMMVPPQLYNEVQKGNHVQSCPSCHRILYIPVQNGGATNTAPAAEKGNA